MATSRRMWFRYDPARCSPTTKHGLDGIQPRRGSAAPDASATAVTRRSSPKAKVHGKRLAIWMTHLIPHDHDSVRADGRQSRLPRLRWRLAVPRLFHSRQRHVFPGCSAGSMDQPECSLTQLHDVLRLAGNPQVRQVRWSRKEQSIPRRREWLPGRCPVDTKPRRCNRRSKDPRELTGGTHAKLVFRFAAEMPTARMVKSKGCGCSLPHWTKTRTTSTVDNNSIHNDADAEMHSLSSTARDGGLTDA